MNAVAKSLSDLVEQNIISHKSDSSHVRSKLFEILKSHNSEEKGFISAVSPKKMFFDRNQDGPVLYDIVNLQVSVTIKLIRIGGRLKKDID